MRIEADFSKISSSFQPLEDGEYQCRIESIEMGETKANKLPQVIIKSAVADPNHPDKEGFPLYHYIVLRTNKDQPNRIGLGQLKAYAEAILGPDAANNTEGFDLDDLKDGTFIAVVGQRSYDKKIEGSDATESKVSNEIKKVLPVG